MNHKANTTSNAKTCKTSASRGGRTANATTGRGAAGRVAAAPVVDPKGGSLATAAAAERLCTPPMKTLATLLRPTVPGGVVEVSSGKDPAVQDRADTRRCHKF